MNGRYYVYSADPSAAWVSHLSVDKRLDASYFSADHLSLDDRLGNVAGMSWVTLSDCWNKPRRVLYMQTKSYDRQDRPDDGVPFISGVDLDAASLTIDWQRVRYVDGWMAHRYQTGLLQPGTLLIKVKGPNQSAVFVNHTNSEAALISGSILFAWVRRIDPHFLVAYLCSGDGYRWRTRLRTNTIVEFTSAEELADVPVPEPEPDIQRAIGNRVRRAERLRELALEHRRRATARLLTELSWPITLPPATHEFKRPEIISPDRLDANYYQPPYLAVRSHIQSLPGGWSPLGDIVSSMANGVEIRKFVNEGYPYVRVGEVEAGRIKVDVAPRISPDGSDVRRGRSRVGEVLVVRSASIGQAADVLEEEVAADMIVAADFIRLIPKDSIRPGYLSAFLNSSVGQLLQEQAAYGTIQLKINQEELATLPIPLIDPEVQGEIEAESHNWRRRLNECSLWVERAKAAVEALLDGTLDVPALLEESAETERWLAANPSPHGRSNGTDGAGT